MSVTRIFFATDVHGSELCFKKFLTAANAYKANAIILGGDITGKMIIPIVQTGNSYSATLFEQERTAKNQEELEALKKDIRDVGYYPYLTDSQEVVEIKQNKEKQDQLFTRLMVESIGRWVKMAEERLKSSGIKCFISPGNDDILAIDAAVKASDYVIDPEGTVVEIGGHEMISCGYSNITPWNCPRDIPEEKLSEKIESMTIQVKRMESCIFNLHCPPFDSKLDTAPELDKNLRTMTRGGQPSEIPVGSHAVRAAIEKHQPLLGLHGHIHESRATARIGRTLCVNPGSEYTEGLLRGTIVNLEEERVKNQMFVCG
jgi:hypothetical protein